MNAKFTYFTKHIKNFRYCNKFNKNLTFLTMNVYVYRKTRHLETIQYFQFKIIISILLTSFKIILSKIQ